MKAKEIAIFLKRDLNGENIPIQGYGSLSNCKEGDIVFIAKWSDKAREKLSLCEGVLAIVPSNCKIEMFGKISYVESNNPRLDFVKVVRRFFIKDEIEPGIHPTAVVEAGANIGQDVTIGPNCFIGNEVTIGPGTSIFSNVSIFGKVSIGRNCYIKPSAVIGGTGFGFEYDENGVPVQFPHTGEIVIGDNVYIGANTSIDRATMDKTIIENNVKIDNNVLIGHNCHIKENVIIVGGCVICGGVVVEANAWIAPNSSIHQKLKVGKKSKVGMGSVVLTNVRDETTVFGVPATKFVIGHKKK